MACTADMITQQQQQQQQANNGQNSNVFYLDSITLNQFNDNISTIVMSSPNHQSPQQFNTQPTQQQQQQQDHQQGSPFGQNDGLFYDSSQTLTLNTMTTESSFLKTDVLPGLYQQQHQTNNNGHQQHLSNSSHCTTPQTPSSIPDIILTGK